MDWPLITARFLHFATMLTLGGASFYRAALAPTTLAPRLILGEPWLARGAWLSALAWLILVARAMAGEDFNLTALQEIATTTAFGQVWLPRLLCLTLLLFAKNPRHSALLAALATASLGLVGHATLQDGALGLAHRAVRAVHLLSLAYWLGGLAPFLVCLHHRARADARAAMRLWSRGAHGAVALAAMAGVGEMALTSGPWPLNSLYREGLAAKIAAFAAMLALALANRYVFLPQRRFWLLALGAWAEIGLGLAALALVSAFGLLDPKGN